VGLEDLIREATKRGLTHLSLHPVHSEDNKTVYWRCTATPSTMHKYVHVTTNDPVEAIEQVLKALPKAPARKDPEPKLVLSLADGCAERLAEADAKLTAAVSGPAGVEGPPIETPPGPSGVEGPDYAPHAVPDPGPTDEWERFK
jgi:hypothetical protein